MLHETDFWFNKISFKKTTVESYKPDSKISFSKVPKYAFSLYFEEVLK